MFVVVVVGGERGFDVDCIYIYFVAVIKAEALRNLEKKVYRKCRDVSNTTESLKY